MGNKRFYWLQLPINFRERPEIKRLYRKHPEHADTIAMTYIDILSHVANTDGVFTVGEGADSLSEELAMMIDRTEEDVDATCDYLQKVNCMVVLEENRKADFPYLREIVGSETDSAGRMRAKRERDREASQSDGEVSQSDTEKERDIEGDIETETEAEKQGEPDRDSEHTTHTDNNACARVREGGTLNVGSCSVDTAQDDGFEDFWEAYPRKIGKAAARSAWVNLNPGYEMQVKLVNAVKRQTESNQWQRDEGRYIPRPERWLQEGRWDDEPDTEIDVFSQVDMWAKHLDEAPRKSENVIESEGHFVNEEEEGRACEYKDAPPSSTETDTESVKADVPRAEPCNSLALKMYADITRDQTNIPECVDDALRGWFLAKEKRGRLTNEFGMKDTIERAIRYAGHWHDGGKYVAGFIRECTDNGEDGLDFRRILE